MDLKRTKNKIEEAKHFLDRLKTTQDLKKFLHELSAFLSASRSVTFVLQKDLGEFKENYGLIMSQLTISESELLKYFKSKRNIALKEGDFLAKKSYLIPFRVEIPAHGTVKISGTTEEFIKGKIRAEIIGDPGKPVNLELKEVTTNFYFTDRRDKPVTDLCDEYLTILMNIIEKLESKYF